MSMSVGNRRRSVRGAAWVLCLLPLGALADQPDRPVDSVPNFSDPSFPQGGNSGGSDNPMRVGRHRPTDAEWTQASAFLKKYSPKRMALVGVLTDGQLKQHLRTVIYSRYLALLKVEEFFPQIYHVQLQRVTIEDSLFDLHRQYNTATTARKATLREEMHQQVQALFDNLQQDRQTRIDRMKTWAADLQTKKNSDEQNRDTVINQQLQEVILHGPDAWGKETRPRRNGGVNLSAPSPEDANPGQDFQPTTNPG